jgi:signal transduction histidine kinase/CheY-like chemotaxis protein
MSAPTASRWDAVALAVAAAVALVGVVVIAGWHLRVGLLVRVVPGAIPMQYNTALCFLLLGAGAAAVAARRGRPILPVIGGGAAALMGLLVAVEYATGTSLGVDTLFFYPWDRTLSADPGRMALTTAVSFFLSGVALALFELRPRTIDYFAVAHTLPLSFGLTSLLGYLLGITYVLPFRLGTQMAVHTALAFTLYGGAMISYAWDHAPLTRSGLPRWSPGIAAVMVPVLFVSFSSASQNNSAPARTGQLVFALAGAALLAFAVHRLKQARIVYKGLILISIPLVFVLAFVVLVNQLKRGSERTELLSSRSKEAIVRSHTLLSGLVDAQSGVRGYVLTEDASFLAPYEAAIRRIPEDANRLRELVDDSDEQEARAERLAALAAERMRMLAEINELVGRGGRGEAVARIKRGDGERLMGEFRREIESFLAEESRLNGARQQGVRDSWQRFDWLLVAGASADLLLALTLAFLFTRGIGQRLRTLTENARALAEGRELAAPLTGADEIAQLDEVFHRMTEELRGAREGLEAKVEERTAELSRANEQLKEQIAERLKAEESLRESEEKLLQSQKLEAVGRLAGGIAHDFNNLLTAIVGYAELTVRRLPEESAMRRNVEEIRKAGERAAALTRQLLAFSRKQVLQPKVIDLNAVVADIDGMLRRLIGEDVDVRTVLASGLGRVKADPGQLQQVVMNLAVNARDAMPGGGKLTIETANVELSDDYARRHGAVEPGRYVMLAVSDTGAGMDAATQARVFEPFFTTKEVGKGTGLGLSTVYGIVKQSGGNVWVYSEVGRGTTFKIYLPRVEEEADSPQATERSPDAPRPSETILLVEDEEGVRRLLKDVLEAEGYRVIETASGGEALERCRDYEGEIHLMLTDVIMPGMSGREIAERAAPLRPGMRVIFMSGYTDESIVHHGVLDAGVEFLEKPFTPDAVARKIRSVLEAGG